LAISQDQHRSGKEMLPNKNVFTWSGTKAYMPSEHYKERSINNI